MIRGQDMSLGGAYVYWPISWYSPESNPMLDLAKVSTGLRVEEGEEGAATKRLSRSRLAWFRRCWISIEPLYGICGIKGS